MSGGRGRIIKKNNNNNKKRDKNNKSPKLCLGDLTRDNCDRILSQKSPKQTLPLEPPFDPHLKKNWAGVPLTQPNPKCSWALLKRNNVLC